MPLATRRDVLFCFVFLFASSLVFLFRSECAFLWQGLEKQFRENLVRLAQGIKRDRRQDLKSLVEQRKHTLEQIRAEVESLESMIDPQEDEQRIDRLMKSARPVDMKEYVVIPPVIHMTWKTKRLPHYGRNNYNT